MNLWIRGFVFFNVTNRFGLLNTSLYILCMCYLCCRLIFMNWVFILSFKLAHCFDKKYPPSYLPYTVFPQNINCFSKAEVLKIHKSAWYVNRIVGVEIIKGGNYWRKYDISYTYVIIVGMILITNVIFIASPSD